MQDLVMLTPVKTFAERLKSAREAVQLNQKELAARARLSAGAIGNYEAGTREMPRDLLGLAAALNVRAEWLGTGKGPRNRENPTQVAQAMSLVNTILTPQLLEWDALTMNPLPKAFKVAAPDDSMAPRLRTGQLVEFETGLDPRPGDGVLVSDGEGVRYIRLYRQGRHGHWEALADNPGYQPLSSERDSLTVLAVLISVNARWG